MADQEKFMFYCWGTVLENKPYPESGYCRMRIQFDKPSGYKIIHTVKAFKEVFDDAKVITPDSYVLVAGETGYRSYQIEGEASKREEIFITIDRIHVKTLGEGPAPQAEAPRAAPAKQAAMTFEADADLPF